MLREPRDSKVSNNNLFKRWRGRAVKNVSNQLGYNRECFIKSAKDITSFKNTDAFCTWPLAATSLSYAEKQTLP